ncbi:arginine--tRNA ligase [Candidatus Microgenomates bacterium]|nr:arginine--tRNA ligase [Candidatus Microgenomates bacterium]
MKIKLKLQNLVWRAGKKFVKDLKLSDVHLEHPENPDHGDYSSNIALVFAKKEGKKPVELARKIIKQIEKTEEIERVQLLRPGFINFWLSQAWLGKQVEEVIKEKDKFGGLTIGKGKKLMVEFSHPNTLKPFHIGHLRNIILGESICRILAANGFKVIRANYQGDVGLHIAKCLWAFAKLKTNPQTLDQKIEFLGKAYAEGNEAYEENEKAKKEIIELNHKIYEKDSEIMPLWKETRAWSLDYFDRIYKRVDTKFDRLYFENEVAEQGKKIVLQHLDKVFAKSEGAIIFDGEKYGLHKRVFINKLGFPTYEAKDMELARLQFKEHNPDLIIHVVGPEQQSYFQVVFKALELIFPETKDKEYHRVYGWVRLKKGKMASRLGKVVLGEWLIDEVKKRLSKEFKMEDASLEIVAVAAVKYSMLKLSPLSEIAFDIDESISLEGNSGPYLQYTYARCCSVLQKAVSWCPTSIVPPSEEPELSSVTSQEGLPNIEELALLRIIYKFPEVVLEAGERYAPNLICNFLFDLAQKFNLFYSKHRIIASSHLRGVQAHTSQERLRLALTTSVSQVLKNGLNMLGIKTLEKM